LYLKSSFALKQKLETLTFDPSRTRLFTTDATAMYTNIDMDHALEKIASFLLTSPLAAGINARSVICVLTIIMHRNYFKFGDTYWLQMTGTAMGTPRCAYATLYYGIWELKIISLLQASLPFYCRYI
jgi:hypothetical protein